jgi:hypothetical protein
MITPILSLYLGIVLLSSIFFGMIYYQNRKTEYRIIRVDFPSGLTANDKYDLIKSFIQTRKIKEVRGIYMCGSESGRLENLDNATFVYLDYIV